MKSTTLYLHFNGQCREAIEFYASIFGGTPEFKTYGESGMAKEKDMENKILHASLMNGGFALMASDTMERADFAKSGFSIALDCDSFEEMQNAFGKISETGKVILDIHDAFWGGKFGMASDKYDITWLFSLA